jgi:hypothetical protein
MKKWYRSIWFSGSLVLGVVGVGAATWLQRPSLSPEMERDLSDRLGVGFFTDFDLERFVLTPDDTSSQAEFSPGAGPPTGLESPSSSSPDRVPPPQSLAPHHPARLQPALQGGPNRAQDRAPQDRVSRGPQGGLLPGPQDRLSRAPQTGVRPRASLDPQDPAATSPETIMARYEPRFRALEQLAMERLDALYDAGRGEYARRRNDGTLNRVAVVNKYLQAGRLLEKNIDAAFYDLLADLRQELERHNHGAARARPVETEYVNRKNRMRTRFLDRLGLR